MRNAMHAKSYAALCAVLSSRDSQNAVVTGCTVGTSKMIVRVEQLFGYDQALAHPEDHAWAAPFTWYVPSLLHMLARHAPPITGPVLKVFLDLWIPCYRLNVAFELHKPLAHPVTGILGKRQGCFRARWLLGLHAGVSGLPNSDPQHCMQKYSMQ